MPSRVVGRLCRRREGRIAERTGRYHDYIGIVALCAEDLRTAVGAEVEDALFLVGLVGDARVVAEAIKYLDLVGLEPNLHAERVSGSTLAGKAVADRDRKWIPVTSRRSCPQWQAASRVSIGGQASAGAAASLHAGDVVERLQLVEQVATPFDRLNGER